MVLVFDVDGVAIVVVRVVVVTSDCLTSILCATSPLVYQYTGLASVYWSCWCWTSILVILVLDQYTGYTCAGPIYWLYWCWTSILDILVLDQYTG